MRGFTKPLILVLINKQYMIDKNVIKTTVEEWLGQNDYYLVDVEMTPDDRIVIEIDHADGVWIEDCADLSRFLQEKLGEELGDYELEVGSAGIGQPFKVLQQYRNHIGKEVEVLHTGVEPVRCRHHQILSLARLPIPSHRRFRVLYDYITKHPRFQVQSRDRF